MVLRGAAERRGGAFFVEVATRIGAGENGEASCSVGDVTKNFQRVLEWSGRRLLILFFFLLEGDFSVSSCLAPAQEIWALAAKQKKSAPTRGPFHIDRHDT
jgi:hypothetical protein